jgi:hypothetical protein
MTGTTMTIETKATAAKEARWQHLGGSGQLGSGGGSLARVLRWWWRQGGGSVGSGSVAVVEAAVARMWQLGSNNGGQLSGGWGSLAEARLRGQCQRVGKAWQQQPLQRQWQQVGKRGGSTAVALPPSCSHLLPSWPPPPPPPRYRCLHRRRAAAALNPALLPSCRRCRQAGCRLRGAAAALPPLPSP